MLQIYVALFTGCLNRQRRIISHRWRSAYKLDFGEERDSPKRKASGTSPTRRAKEERGEKAAALNKMKQLYQDVTDDDVDSIQIYEKLFFTESMNPYTRGGTAKLLLADAKVKASISYHDSKTSTRKNTKQISNASTATGKEAFLDLAFWPFNCNAYHNIEHYSTQ